MAIKYLYLDDENIASLEPLIDGICEGSDELAIVVKHPKDFEDNIDNLSDMLSDFDGVILDWRLDEIQGSAGRAKFRAGSLAQEIRTRATGKEINDLPIVLWSTNEKLQVSYKGDDTSHDLFDEIYLKERIAQEPLRAKNQLISLGKGYTNLRTLPEKNNLRLALGEPLDRISYLDVNFTATLSQYEDVKVPVHKIARFILNECIHRPGLLIDEKYLGAKLGVDIEQSTDWPRLRDDFLKVAKYNGVFHDSWERWWLSEILEWWTNLGNVKPVSRYNAIERVKILQEHLKLTNLQAAAPIMDHYSSSYDTVCQHYQRPLDKLDGVMINEEEPKSWQDRRYLSLKAILTREYKDTNKWAPHPIELERLEELRKSSQ